MTLIVGTPTERTGGGGSATFTVPVGVTPDMVALIVLATSDNVAPGTSLSGGGGTFTPLDVDRQAGNCRVTVIKATELTAGDTITLAQTTPTLAYIAHIYQDDHDYVTASLAATVRASSISTCTTGSVTPAAGQRVAVVSVERTTATGTTVSSVVSDGAETVTQDTYAETAGATANSCYLGSFVSGAAAARTVTLTYSAGSGNGYAAAVLTTPIVAVAPEIHYTSAVDTLAVGACYYTSDVDTLAIPAEVRPIPTGYPSVTAMLAASPFYVAHRGGSLDWAEMSLNAYTQSVFWGVPALEVSIARTSDGVFFGLHDQSLDRTSGTTGFIAADHTWAEIQAHEIEVPVGSTPQPYMRWEELMDAYYDTHVIFVDPKHMDASDRLALLDLMDAQPGSADRFVWKFYGVSSTYAPPATARGYQAWGYFYQADVPVLAANQAQWTLLGMDYLADAPSWAAALSYGKPVIGHIVPTLAGATTALGLGADGLMVSGVQATIPRSA